MPRDIIIPIKCKTKDKIVYYFCFSLVIFIGMFLPIGVGVTIYSYIVNDRPLFQTMVSIFPVWGLLGFLCIILFYSIFEEESKKITNHIPRIKCKCDDMSENGSLNYKVDDRIKDTFG